MANIDVRQYAQNLMDEHPEIFTNKSTLTKLLIAQKILEYHVACEQEFQDKRRNVENLNKLYPETGEQ